MNVLKKIDTLRKLFSRLNQILIDEKELNWLPLIENILGKIDNNSDASGIEVLNYIRDSFGKCFAGNGSFSDFNIWKDDYYERKKANKELDKLNNKIIKLLDL